MGVLIDGRWTEEDLRQEIAASGEFKRLESRWRDRITAGGAPTQPASPMPFTPSGLVFAGTSMKSSS